MSQDNPFRTPVTESQSTSTSTSSHAIVRAWEKLRIVYNLILAVPGLLILVAYIVFDPTYALVGIVGSAMMAVFANICFFAGPGAELYLACQRNQHEFPKVRIPMFICGVLFSLIPFANALFFF